MTVHEVAAYLRIKERKVYDLVSQQRIPASRVTGKWLFSRDEIDR
ncbi:MAG: helix-turn-helix domain-containing protein, partial [Alphaproteobacteria bacterium]|nr:helix-turn-helix domain-containing protein [Alphaproteobacteria bacterium]